MSVIKKLASQTATYGLSTMLGRFINFLLVPLYLSKLSGAADYGVVSVMFTYASFFAIVFALGLETAFFHYSRLTQQPAKVLATTSYFLILTGSAAMILARWFGPQIMCLIGYPQYPQFAEYFSIILASDALTGLGFAWLRQQEKPWTFVWIRLSNIGINVSANLFFLVACPLIGHHIALSYPGDTFSTPLWQNIGNWCSQQNTAEKMISNIFISHVLASILTIPLLFKTWSNLKEGFDFALLKKMLRYSLPLVIVGLAGMVNETLDRILLKEILPANLGDSEAGMYSAFYKLSLVLTLFVQAFRFAAEPFFFSKAGDKDAPETYALVMRYFVYFSGGIYLLTMVFLPWIAPLLLQKPLYYNNLRGISVVPVLLAANLCLGIYYNLSIWFKLTGRTKMGGAIASISAIVTIAGNIVFIPKFGFVASAYTTLASYALLMLMGYFFGQKFYPVPYNTILLLFVLSIAIVPILILPLCLPSLSHNFYFLLPLLYLLIVYIIEKFQKPNVIG